MFEIKEATLEDLNAIEALWLQLMAIHKTFDPDFFAASDDFIDMYSVDLEYKITDNMSHVLVAWHDNKIVGFVTAEIAMLGHFQYNLNNYCVVHDIMVAEEFINLGIGNSFLDTIKKWALTHRTNHLRLSVFSPNTKANSFFDKLGFEEKFKHLYLEF